MQKYSLSVLCKYNPANCIWREEPFTKGKKETPFMLLPFLLLSGMKVIEVVCSCISRFALLERKHSPC